MGRSERIALVKKMIGQVSDSGIEAAKAGGVGVGPDATTLDEFMLEYLRLQSDIRRARALIKYSLGPTRDVKTPKLQEALAILTEIDDKDEPKPGMEGVCPVTN